MLKHCTLIIFFFFSSLIFAQEKINQMDANGNRHGLWRKKYRGTDQIRYEGTFEHGKETGLFKFYKEDSKDQPAATKYFHPDSELVDVKFYTKKGELVSEGQMKGDQRQGKWIIYHLGSKQIMSEENYVNDTLNGKRIVYFPNGRLAEESHYKNGVLHGSNKIYSEEGPLMKEYTYANGELHGPVKYYTASGELEIEGRYKENLRDGIWKYYKNGRVSYTKKFPEALSERK